MQEADFLDELLLGPRSLLCQICLAPHDEPVIDEDGQSYCHKCLQEKQMEALRAFRESRRAIAAAGGNPGEDAELPELVFNPTLVLATDSYCHQVQACREQRALLTKLKEMERNLILNGAGTVDSAAWINEAFQIDAAIRDAQKEAEIWRARLEDLQKEALDLDMLAWDLDDRPIQENDFAQPGVDLRNYEKELFLKNMDVENIFLEMTWLRDELKVEDQIYDRCREYINAEADADLATEVGGGIEGLAEGVSHDLAKDSKLLGQLTYSWEQVMKQTEAEIEVLKQKQAQNQKGREVVLARLRLMQWKENEVASRVKERQSEYARLASILAGHQRRRELTGGFVNALVEVKLQAAEAEVIRLQREVDRWNRVIAMPSMPTSQTATAELLRKDTAESAIEQDDLYGDIGHTIGVENQILLKLHKEIQVLGIAEEKVQKRLQELKKRKFEDDGERMRLKGEISVMQDLLARNPLEPAGLLEIERLQTALARMRIEMKSELEERHRRTVALRNTVDELAQVQSTLVVKNQILDNLRKEVAIRFSLPMSELDAYASEARHLFEEVNTFHWLTNRQKFELEESSRSAQEFQVELKKVQEEIVRIGIDAQVRTFAATAITDFERHQHAIATNHLKFNADVKHASVCLAEMPLKDNVDPEVAAVLKALEVEKGPWKVSHDGLASTSSHDYSRDANVPPSSAGADVALRTAAAAGNVDLTRNLCAAGAAINSVDERGVTALHLAAIHGHSDVARVLAASGATLDRVDQSGRSPLHEASEAGHSDVVRLLCGLKADVQKVDTSGSAPLHLAVRRNRVDAVRYLGREDAGDHLRDIRGWTPLMMASSLGNPSIVSLLLRERADLHITAADGSTALSLAEHAGYTDIVSLLSKRSA